MPTITCEPGPNGNVEIIGSGTISAQEASMLIVEIAKAAIEAHARSDRQLPDRMMTEVSVPFLSPTAIGLSPGPRDDLVLLSLQFGAVEVGVPISISDGRQIGEARIAASADRHSVRH